MRTLIGHVLERVSGEPWLHGPLTIAMRRIAPQIRILGLYATTSPNDCGFSVPHECPRDKRVDTRNFSSGNALGNGRVDTKSVDTRKSNPCKAVTTCRHFGGVRALRVFRTCKTTKEARKRRLLPPSIVTSA